VSSHEITPQEMAGLLKKLRERDIRLMTESFAPMMMQDFREFAKTNETISSAMFFDPGAQTIHFRSAPGVVHELSIRRSDQFKNGMTGYRGDVVIHSARRTEAFALENRYGAVWLKHYIKEDGA
jgi:hypothetical protein